MAFVPKSVVKAAAQQIRNEHAERANTASRVGTMESTDVDSAMYGLDVSSYGAVPGGTAAANSAAIALAIADALATGGSLWWPPGASSVIYDVNANIANFHSVKHHGPGAVRRGSDTFYVSPKTAQTNTLYVSSSGSASNDGITSSQPMTLAQVFAVLPNYGPSLDGTWRVRLAAGTYASASNVVSGLRSCNRIEFYGPDVGGHPNVPTAIVDGTSAGTDACGMYFRNGMSIYVKDIKFRNFDATGNGCGIAADEHSNLYIDNVHTTGCANGTDIETASRLYVKGGIHAGNQLYNIRAYAQCTVTIGYGGSVGANRPSIGSVVNGGGAGILVRDDSSGHIDYTDVNGVAGSGGGVQVQNQSRVHLVSCVFGGTSANYYNVRCDNQSTFVETGCTFNAATAKSVVEFGFSIDTDGNQSVYYDRATSFFRFGLATNINPGVPWLYQASEPTGGIGYNSNVVMALEKDGNPYFGFGSAATGSAGFMFARNGANNQGRIEYFHSNDTFQMRVNAVDSFRWHSTYFRPEVDNAVSLGDSTHTFTELWIGGVSVSFGAGAPASTKPNGSLYLRTGGTGPNLYVRENGAWVAK